MLEPARTGAWFSGTVSLLALLIAATGIYGVLSYHVVERTSEIGIRMALGAQRRGVLLLIVRDGMKLTAIGIAIGLVAAIAVDEANDFVSIWHRSNRRIDVCARLPRRPLRCPTRLLHSGKACDQSRSADCPSQRVRLHRLNATAFSASGAKYDSQRRSSASHLVAATARDTIARGAAPHLTSSRQRREIQLPAAQLRISPRRGNGAKYNCPRRSSTSHLCAPTARNISPAAQLRISPLRANGATYDSQGQAPKARRPWTNNPNNWKP